MVLLFFKGKLCDQAPKIPDPGFILRNPSGRGICLIRVYLFIGIESRFAEATIVLRDPCLHAAKNGKIIIRMRIRFISLFLLVLLHGI